MRSNTIDVVTLPQHALFCVLRSLLVVVIVVRLLWSCILHSPEIGLGLFHAMVCVASFTQTGRYPRGLPGRQNQQGNRHGELEQLSVERDGCWNVAVAGAAHCPGVDLGRSNGCHDNN